MFDLSTCRFVVYGFRKSYCTHSHIHEGLYRALCYMGRDTEWLDDAPARGWDNTFVITNHDQTDRLPLRDDVFYLVHGMGDHQGVRERIAFTKLRMSWNVFHDY